MPEGGGDPPSGTTPAIDLITNTTTQTRTEVPK